MQGSRRSGLLRQRFRPLRRLALAGRNGRLFRLIEAAALFAAVAMAISTYLILTGKGAHGRLLTPALLALLLVANLVPLMGLLVLLARRIAKRRAEKSALGGGGRLHVRLVALFSVIAAVPTLLVVIFASLLFQYGVEFWFSDRARTVLENSDRVAQAYVDENKHRIVGEIVPMAGDLANYLGAVTIDDPRFSEGFAKQVAYRSLSQAAIVVVAPDKGLRLLLGANLDSRPLEQQLPLVGKGPFVQGAARVSTASGDRVETVVALDRQGRTLLYASRRVDPLVLRQVARARSALGDYASLIARARLLQLRFNAALLIVSLAIVGASIWIALVVADRLVRPVNDLVGAARRVTAGDLSVRVDRPTRRDEVGTLTTAFNRMTRTLEDQTGALVAANAQLESRRALTEAVLSGVSAGVLSVDGERRVRLVNQPADALLQTGGAAVGRPLAEASPELDALFDRAPAPNHIVQIAGRGGEPRTLAVTLVASGQGHVLTFDDITQQLNDQRRAAWADVARRIAHEIKNPLTPIQLAAERLQRRYGKQVTADRATFDRLTETIVRQVGDLRRMVDEFSSFARMPKPVFRPEALAEIGRQALFLHEVAHPGVRFTLDAPEPSPLLVCDRRQLGQALTNIVKNAVEAIEQRAEPAEGNVAMTIEQDGVGGRICLSLADDGIGLPAERERLTEPYMTTRARGTGLGLAIVRKIVEEHLGTIAFADRPAGGTIVRIGFDPAALAALEHEGGAGDEEGGEATPSELTRMRAG